MKLTFFLLIPAMSLAFIPGRLPSLVRGKSSSSSALLRRAFTRAATRSDKVAVTISNNDNSVELSWPGMENTQCYHVVYKPTTAEDYSLLVSSRNSTKLNNLTQGMMYEYTISPLCADEGLLEATHSGEFSLEVKSKLSTCVLYMHDSELMHFPPQQAKTESTSKPTPDNDIITDITPLEIRVGRIVEVCKHPEADKLYIEKIDCGEDGGPRTIVSGLVQYCSQDELLNRKVIVLCNLKPRPLVGVLSHGMVLCASDADHSRVDPLAPPDGASVGELIYFRGHVCDPKPPGNAAVKAFKRVADKLFSSGEGVATFDGEPFMTQAGPCTTRITNGKVS